MVQPLTTTAPVTDSGHRTEGSVPDRSVFALSDNRVYVAVVAMPGEGRRPWAVGWRKPGQQPVIAVVADPTFHETTGLLFADLHASGWKPDGDGPPDQWVVANRRTVDLLRSAVLDVGRDIEGPHARTVADVEFHCWRFEYEGQQVVVPVGSWGAHQFGLEATELDPLAEAYGRTLPDSGKGAPDDIHTHVDFDDSTLVQLVNKQRSARTSRRRVSAAKLKADAIPIRKQLGSLLKERLDRLEQAARFVEQAVPVPLTACEQFAADDTTEWERFVRRGWRLPGAVTDLANREAAADTWTVARLEDTAALTEAHDTGHAVSGTAAGTVLTTTQPVTRTRPGSKWQTRETSVPVTVTGTEVAGGVTTISTGTELGDGPVTLMPVPPDPGSHGRKIRQMITGLTNQSWLTNPNLPPPAAQPRTWDPHARVWELRDAPAPEPVTGLARDAHDAVTAALTAVRDTEPGLLVPSPPGAGKTWLVEGFAALAADDNQTVLVVCQTNAQARAICERVAAGFGTINVTWLHATSNTPPAPHPDVQLVSSAADIDPGPRVVVATAAKTVWINRDHWTPDLMVVDEAWQMQWAQMQTISGLTDRFVMVGDHMQLPPVTSADTRRWENLPWRPDQSTPDAVADNPHVRTVHLPATRRFGPETARLLSTVFYPEGESFGSLSPEPDTRMWAGTEVAWETVTYDRIVHTVAARANAALEHGTVGVVAPHVSAVAAIAAACDPAVHVETTERWQGLEADRVVVVHPTAVDDPSGFEIAPGRLCVALSRHRHQTLVVAPHDFDHRVFLASLQSPADPGVAAHLAVRNHLESSRL